MTQKTIVNRSQLSELLLQALETELGGEQIYRMALACTTDERLRREWTRNFEQTRKHQIIVRDLIVTLGGNPDALSPGRSVLRARWLCLVSAMDTALTTTPRGAQLVACECVVDAETKDHLNWQLLSLVASSLESNEAQAVRKAVAQVENEEDEHLYHTAGWCRELWLAELGLDAVLPPPEERRDVRTAISAAHAAYGRQDMA